MPSNGNPRQGAGGSLRRPDAFKEPSEETKKEVTEIVENDPALAALLGGAPDSIDHLTQPEAPGDAWLNESPAAAPTAVAIDTAKVERPRPSADAWSEDPEASPWAPQAPSPEPAPPSPTPAPESAPASQEPSEEPKAEEADKPEQYQCLYHWENDPETFSADALLRGSISDVCQLNATLKVRVRALSGLDLMSVDDYMPKLQEGGKSEAWLQMARGITKLALAITHINGRPLGSVEERIKLLRQFPEQLVFRLEDIYYEFGQRLHMRIRGARELLKN